MTKKKRINMWSGPRNVSTAIMYSFAQRRDTLVVDEPFYAHYLLQSHANHPGQTKIIESQSSDPAEVLQNLLSMNKQKVVFLKNMAHHMIAMDNELNTLIKEFQHVFLIRDPAEMLISLDKSLPGPTLRDTAYKRQIELFKMVKSQGFSPLVIDSRELLKDPEFMLSILCNRLNLTFENEMLSWDPGPIPEDGVWASYWYENVHQSTGFQSYIPHSADIPPRLKSLYKVCKPIYNKLLAHAIKINNK